MKNTCSSWPWKFAAAGAAISIIFALLTMVGGWFVHGETLTSYLWMGATILISWPAQHLFGIFGWSGVPIQGLAMFATNAVILALCGAGIGLILRSARR